MAILACLRGPETVSPSELAGELDLPIGTISYHVRRLERLGLLELVECRQRRGTIQHHYALAPGAAVSELVRQATAGAAGASGPPASASDSEPSRATARALLDATAIGELRAELRGLFERLRALETETVRRAGVKGRARTFAVDVTCVMDAEQGAGN